MRDRLSPRELARASQMFDDLEAQFVENVATGRVVEGSVELTPEEMIQYQNLRTDSDREEFSKTLEARRRALLDDLARQRKS